jgi:hypothetical protein
MVNYDETSGIRGLKQIARSLVVRGELSNEQKDGIFEHHTHNYLNRCYPGWMKEPQHDDNRRVPKKIWYL